MVTVPLSVTRSYNHDKGQTEEDGRSGSYFLDKLTVTVHLRITSHEYPNLRFLITSPSNRVCI